MQIVAERSGLSPETVRRPVSDMFIVTTPFFVPVPYMAFGSSRSNPVFFYDTVNAVWQRTADKNVETVVSVLQGIIGAPAHNQSVPALSLAMLKVCKIV